LTGAAVAWGLAGHRSVGGEQLFSFVLLVFLLGYFFSFIVFFPLHFKKIVELTLSQSMSFCTFTLLILSPIPLGGGVSEQLAPC